jgi:hypothetical protein
MWAPGVPAWSDVTVIDPRTTSKPRFIGRVVRAAPSFDALVVNGSARFHDLYRDLIAAILAGRRRNPTPLVVAEVAWDLGSAPLSRLLGIEGLALPSIARLGVRALDGDHVTYCMFSREERDLFTRTFGVPAERTEVVRFAHTLWSRADGPTSDGGYLFAGGDSLRDYGTLLAAVDGLDVPVRIATNHDLGPLPANVTCGPVPYEEYVELIAGARMVVVPMQSTRRAAGLITYLDAMALGKPTIITDSPAVGEYVEQGRTAMVVPPEDPAAMRDAIAWALDPGNAGDVEAMRVAARASVSHPAAYWQSLRDVAERAARRGARRANAP